MQTLDNDDVKPTDDAPVLFVAPNLQARCDELGIACKIDESLPRDQWAMRSVFVKPST